MLSQTLQDRADSRNQSQAAETPRIKCVRFRPLQKNSLRGFADIQIFDIGLTIRDCPVHCRGDVGWVSFPARSYTDNTGAQQWTPILEFTGDKAHRASFQTAALAAIRDFEREGA